jgi:predicted acyltransferase
MATAILTLVAVALFLFGTAWDVQWHVSVGRDRLFTAPHVLMLAGIGLAGLSNLAVLLIARSRVSSGVVLSGLGAFFAALAFILDDYWHALYGIDVAIWAPFHVMIITGVGAAGLGAVISLAAAPGKLGRQFGFSAALALTIATFMVLLPESAGRQALASIGDIRIVSTQRC